MKSLIGGTLIALMGAGGALAQTSPGIQYGQVPTAAQWNSYFSAKTDYLGAPPLLVTGGTMLGLLTTPPPATSGAGFSLPPGTAPTSPNNGDIWSTSSGLYVQINGSTVGPLGASGGAVSSVFGRTGTVTAQSGDYTFSQIGSTPTTLAGYGIASPLPVAQGGTAANTAGILAANNIGALAIASNLSDLNNAGAARTNLGLGTFATANAATPPVIGGTTPAAGSFSSLTDTGITGSTQCVQANSAGLFSGTGAACGSGGSGTVNSGVVGQLAYYASNGTAISGNALATISGGALTLGSTGSSAGSVFLSGLTSGGVTVKTASSGGLWNLTLPTSGGTNLFFLQTNGSGVATWASAFLSSSPSSGVGYTTGSGGTVTQATSKSTAVTLNTITGAITMNGASLGAGAIVSFVINNSSIGATDYIGSDHESGGTTGAYTINCRPTGAGTGACDVRNNTGGALAETLVIRFYIGKSSNS